MNHDNDNCPADLSSCAPEAVRDAVKSQRAIRAKRYRWPDPSTLPRRQWMLGEWLLAGEVTAIIAPGGTGKSTLSTAIALSLASGKPLIGQKPKVARGVWVYNLEDSQEEMEKQVVAACIHHGIGRSECDDRLYLNSGLDMPICVAADDDGKPHLDEDVFLQLEATIRENDIGAVIIDPLISSHRVNESSNEGIDLMVKRWKRLAYQTGCAVVLVHHTKKLGGREATAEDGRGAVALRDAARVVLVLNKLSANEANEVGIDAKERRSIVKVEMGKASRSPGTADTWIKLAGVEIGNGDADEASDNVAVAVAFDRPDAFDGVSADHLYLVQQRLGEKDWRKDAQADDWVGHLIARVIGLDAKTHKAKIKRIQATWTQNGVLLEEKRKVEGKTVPCIAIGKLVEMSELGPNAPLRMANYG